MQIIEKKLSELKPYEKNPRRNDDAVQFVANSIKEFGFKVPIVIDKDGVIVAGHTRYKAAKQLKLKTVPCIIADDLTEEQIKAYRLADNKTAEIAGWDFALLDMELAEITMDMQDFGFTEHSDEYINEFFDEGSKAKEHSSDGSYKVEALCESEDAMNKVVEFLEEIGVEYKVK